MQDNYEYLEDTSGAPFKVELIVGKKFELSLNYMPLFEDLRVIEDNYRFLKKIGHVIDGSKYERSKRY